MQLEVNFSLSPSLCYSLVIFPADGVRDVPDGVEGWLVHLRLSSHRLPSLGAESVQQRV